MCVHEIRTAKANVSYFPSNWHPPLTISPLLWSFTWDYFQLLELMSWDWSSVSGNADKHLLSVRGLGVFTACESRDARGCPWLWISWLLWSLVVFNSSCCGCIKAVKKLLVQRDTSDLQIISAQEWSGLKIWKVFIGQLLSISCGISLPGVWRAFVDFRVLNSHHACKRNYTT